MGSGGKEYAKVKYSLPVPKDMLLGVARDQSPTHTGKMKGAVDLVFANDLSVEDVPVYAAADGKVVVVKNDSNAGGPDQKYSKDANRVEIEHALPDGSTEYSIYEHFKYQGIKVKVGQVVKAGDLLGHSGNTGFTTASHVHFQAVTLLPKGEFKTLHVKFEELGEK